MSERAKLLGVHLELLRTPETSLAINGGVSSSY